MPLSTAPRALAAAIAAIVLSGQAALAGASCPDPKTCDHYVYVGPDVQRWPSGADGLVHVPYRVNPAQPWVDDESAVVAAVRRGFATWESGVPGIRFDYQGTTSLPPVPGDRVNVVGWTPWDPTQAAAAPLVVGGGRIYEADIILSLAAPWGSYPCEQADGSCTPLSRDVFADWWVTRPVWPFPNGGRLVSIHDIQNLVTHEVGHWLWLGDLYGEDETELTLYGITGAADEYGSPLVERKSVTLGLGDVLGARSLYPCDCPLPTIYAP